MNITEYLERINKESQVIFKETIRDSATLGKAHHLSSCIFEFSEFLFDIHEKEMLSAVSAQLESATLSLSLGLYRQAFSSLRLAFEMGLGVTYFSINKMEHYEWIEGKMDIKWARLIDKEKGVLSIRFTNAFFSELTSIVDNYNLRATKVYRSLSEFVHGNYETWSKSGIQIKSNPALINQFFTQFYEVSEIILFVLCCRYLKSISKEGLETMEFIPNEFNHITPIRTLFGGPTG